tara:strand:+ start:1128 stop:1442 length:315 start_codon:yes stop_codon:yes gene_type:complete
MIVMKYKNIILEKLKEAGSLTDKAITKSLVKDGYVLPEDIINKILLGMEIIGLIKVSWVTKNTRRIEIVSKQEEEDEIEVETKKSLEKDYEASFPVAKDELTKN